MVAKPLISVFRAPHDFALKLFREAGRTWNAEGLQAKADHLLNFCVTNSALRDWVIKTLGISVDSAWHDQWRARAGGLFGECADIANASKHLAFKKVSVADTTQELITLGLDGPIHGSGRIVDTFEIILSSGQSHELFLFLHLICSEWGRIFREQAGLQPLPDHGLYFISFH